MTVQGFVILASAEFPNKTAHITRAVRELMRASLLLCINKQTMTLRCVLFLGVQNCSNCVLI